MFFNHGFQKQTTQVLINYVTDAGRYTDDIIPTTFFNGSRKELCLKNTKVSSKYIMKILDICPLLEDIDVSGTFLVDDDLVLNILQKCKNLKSLNIRNCRNFFWKYCIFTSLYRMHVFFRYIFLDPGNNTFSVKQVTQVIKHT